jgi:putative ABC transport system substrate-binding protein
MTGIQVGLEVPKALEWGIKLVPDVHKVFMPYNPDDEVSVMFVELLTSVAGSLDVEIVAAEVDSIEEAIGQLENLAPDIKAIFRIPSPTLDPRNAELSRAGISYGLPTFAGHPVDGDVLLLLESNLYDTGYRTARIAGQILGGIDPAELPVETSEVSLIINLKAARDLGLEIPDMVLHQADKVIR